MNDLTFWQIMQFGLAQFVSGLLIVLGIVVTFALIVSGFFAFELVRYEWRKWRGL